MQTVTTPRRSERIAARMAVKLRRSERLAEKAEKIKTALESYRKIKAACDAAVYTMSGLYEEPSGSCCPRHTALAAAAAVRNDEKEEMKRAKDELYEAWNSYMIARHYAMLSVMRNQPKDEQKQLMMMCDIAEQHLSKCIDYTDTICFGFNDSYDSDDSDDSDDDDDY